MISDNPSYTDPALQVIRAIDPALAARMNASKWWVFTDLVHAPMDLAYVLLREWNNGALGVTLSERTPMGFGGSTWLNVPLLGVAFARENIAVEDVVATTLVHEFVHHALGYDAGEKPAYEAEIAFARKLPPHDSPILDDALKGLKLYGQ